MERRKRACFHGPFFFMADEKLIWDLLMNGIKNPYGVAGLMGNLFAESSLNPMCKTGGNKAISGKIYTEQINTMQIDRDQFAHDDIAYGLAQWRYWSRKEQIYIAWGEYAEKMSGNISIADIRFQVSFLLSEIKTYKTVWNTLLNAKSVKEASDIVLVRYEKPASVGEKTKAKREQFGQDYYDKYALVDQPSLVGKRVRTKVSRVVIRNGNGKEYGAVGTISKAGTLYELIAEAENGWYAIKLKSSVGWVSGEFAEKV